MTDHHVPVGQRVGRRAVEATVQARLLHLPLPLRIFPRSSPARLIHLRGGDEPGFPPDSGESVAERVMPTDHKATSQASESMKAVGVEGLPALSGAIRCPRLLVAAPGALAMASSSDASKPSAAVTLPLFAKERPLASEVHDWLESAKTLLPALLGVVFSIFGRDNLDAGAECAIAAAAVEEELKVESEALLK